MLEFAQNAHIYNGGEVHLLDLYKMMMEAQNGQAMVNMAKQFGISPEQAEAAVRATLPAFSMGLKQNTADGAGMQDFMAALGGGQHMRYFEDAAAMLDSGTMQDGNNILGHLFGSKDTSRVVADQAAEASGIGAAIIKKMLPIIASMIMGGVFRQSQGSGMQDMISEIIRQMTGSGGGNPQGRTHEPQPDNRSQPSSNDPFGDIFRDIIGGMMGGNSNRDRSGSDRPSGRGSSVPGMPELPQTGADFFGSMFDSGVETGNKMQRDQAKAMEQMMDALFQKKRR